jgi:hypothetical protein
MPPDSPLAAPTIGAAWPLRDKVAFASIGTSRFGNFPETDSYGLGCVALNAALDDAGLKPSDIDGLIVNRIPTYERFAEMMGHARRFLASEPVGVPRRLRPRRHRPRRDRRPRHLR